MIPIMSPAEAKKNIQKLQRAIIDGLEDVKAQDIEVFDTEHITSLFERVIVASGTSNRQTKALASSVRDAVHKAGFDKPRMEGNESGEWIIIDCGAAVVHIMQPTIRTYYHLEEIWGEKPVQAKFGAAKPVAKKALTKPVAAKKVAAKKAPAKKATANKTTVKAAPAKKVAAKKAVAAKAPAAKKVVAKKAAVKKSAAKKAPAKKVAAKKVSAKK